MHRLLLVIVLVIPFSSAWGLHVVIDPGHGGKDHGAVHQKVLESEITLQVAQLLKEELSKDKRFSVSLTREGDASLSLKDRAQIAHQKGGQILISIHVNSSTDRRARGGEIYFQNQLPPDEESMFLADKENQKENSEDELVWPLEPVPNAASLSPEVVHIIKDLQRNYRLRASGELAKALVQKWQGTQKSPQKAIRQAPFYVVSNVSMPSVLVELGYLSNRNEFQSLTDPQFQKILAQGLYQGLIRYKEVMDKAPVQPLQ